DRRFDLQPIADDPGVLHEGRALARTELGDAYGGGAQERVAVALPFPENGVPGKPRLSAFESEELEQATVVMHGDAPLLVMIAPHERIVPCPRASPLLGHVVPGREA